jgi:hypothetical protein
MVGFRRSIHTALSGMAGVSEAGSFFRADSEGTYTENMGKLRNGTDTTQRH